jgi:hypothetical protein
MTLDRAALIQSRIEQISALLKNMELTGKEHLFGKEDLIRELRELDMYLGRIKARELQQQLEDYTMNIEFESFHTKNLTFDMVDAGEFFVCVEGNLYQKCYECEDDDKEMAWMICDSDGDPQGRVITFYADEKIERILPKIKRITF